MTLLSLTPRREGACHGTRHCSKPPRAECGRCGLPLCSGHELFTQCLKGGKHRLRDLQPAAAPPSPAPPKPVIAPTAAQEVPDVPGRPPLEESVKATVLAAVRRGKSNQEAADEARVSLSAVSRLIAAAGGREALMRQPKADAAATKPSAPPPAAPRPEKPASPPAAASSTPQRAAAERSTVQPGVAPRITAVTVSCDCGRGVQLDVETMRRIVEHVASTP